MKKTKVKRYWMCHAGCWIILPILRITYERDCCVFLSLPNQDILSIEIAWLTRWCAIEFVFTKK